MSGKVSVNKIHNEIVNPGCAKSVFLRVFAEDSNRPIIWDCSHGHGFAPERVEIMFLHYGR